MGNAKYAHLNFFPNVSDISLIIYRSRRCSCQSQDNVHDSVFKDDHYRCPSELALIENSRKSRNVTTTSRVLKWLGILTYFVKNETGIQQIFLRLLFFRLKYVTKSSYLFCICRLSLCIVCLCRFSVCLSVASCEKNFARRTVFPYSKINLVVVMKLLFDSTGCGCISN